MNVADKEKEELHCGMKLLASLICFHVKSAVRQFHTELVFFFFLSLEERISLPYVSPSQSTTDENQDRNSLKQEPGVRN